MENIYIYCVCHIINLYTQDELRIVNVFIVKLNNIISFMRSTVPRKQKKLKDFVRVLS